MTITVNIGEADLSDLLAKVEAGEDVILARGGMPVARLTAMATPLQQSVESTSEFSKEEQDRRRAAIEEIRKFRKTMPRVTSEEIIEWKNEGRR
jgi:antitoxin (DNA-binding transcriptional repressor) of toxin-antitoxin stability system